jgi:AcrR family transcriptional regulator
VVPLAYRTPKHVQEQKDAKKKHIINSALQVFAQKGFHNTSVQDICKAAGVSIGSIYFYFPNKESILEAVTDAVADEISASVTQATESENDLRELIGKGIRGLFSALNANPSIAPFLRANSYIAEMKQKRDDILQLSTSGFTQILDAVVRKGMIQPLNLELASIVITNAVYSLVRYRNINEGHVEIDEIADFLTAFIVRGLGFDG